MMLRVRRCWLSSECIRSTCASMGYAGAHTGFRAPRPATMASGVETKLHSPADAVAARTAGESIAQGSALRIGAVIGDSLRLRIVHQRAASDGEAFARVGDRLCPRRSEA